VAGIGEGRSGRAYHNKIQEDCRRAVERKPRCLVNVSKPVLESKADVLCNIDVVFKSESRHLVLGYLHSCSEAELKYKISSLTSKGGR
jgi:hypothetical protein